MNHEPLPSNILAAIEACRPDGEDERLPEVAAALADVSPVRVAELRRSIERVDRAIAAAVHQAPLPEGLADRVLARIREEDAARAAPGVNEVRSTETKRRGSDWRRSWLMAGAGMAIAAGLLAAFALPRKTIDIAEIQAQAREFYEANDHRPTPSSAVYPTSFGGVAADAVLGWRAIKFLDRSGYAYELSSRRVAATLYVVPLHAWFGPKLGVSTIPSTQSTSGTTVAAWTDGTEVYVLVIKGEGRALHYFLPRNVA